jgi:hypothetical protein
MPDHASAYPMNVTPVPLNLRVASAPASMASFSLPPLYMMVFAPEAGSRYHEPLQVTEASDSSTRVVPLADVVVPDDEPVLPVEELPVLPVDDEPLELPDDVPPDDVPPDDVPPDEPLLVPYVAVRSTRNVSIRVEHPNAESAPSAPSQVLEKSAHFPSGEICANDWA